MAISPGVTHEVQADVVEERRCPVAHGAVQRDLELARQVGELGVERGPLAQDLGERARVDDLVGATPAKWSVVMLRTQLPLVWIACISTFARSARMSGTRASSGQLYWMFWRVLKWPVAAVVLARDVGERAQLRGGEQAVRDRDAKHRARGAGRRGRSAVAAAGTRRR
jgi:hypothetical protein